MLLTYTRYGLIACRLLTEGYYDNRYIAAPMIAEKFNINARTLMPALRQLTRAGILHSRVGGTEPGFIFTRNPKTISMLEVLLALEGNLRVACCREVIKEVKCSCRSKESCLMFSLFTKLFEQVKNCLAHVSIYDHTFNNKEEAPL